MFHNHHLHRGAEKNVWLAPAFFKKADLFSAIDVHKVFFANHDKRHIAEKIRPTSS